VIGARLAKGRIGASHLVTYAEKSEFLQKKVAKEAKGEGNPNPSADDFGRSVLLWHLRA